MNRMVALVPVLLCAAILGAAAAKKFPWAPDELNAERTVTELEWRLAANRIDCTPVQVTPHFQIRRLIGEVRGGRFVLTAVLALTDQRTTEEDTRWRAMVNDAAGKANAEAGKRFGCAAIGSKNVGGVMVVFLGDALIGVYRQDYSEVLPLNADKNERAKALAKLLE